MNPIKKVKKVYWWLRNQYDPLRGQRLYAHQSLIDKRNTLDFVKCGNDVQMKIKRLWGGRSNEWFEFYNTISGGINTHLYFPDDWFYDYVDAKLNDWKRCSIVDDKGLYDLFFHDIERPETLASCHQGQWLDHNFRLATVNQVAKICQTNGKIIIKPSRNSSGGRGIAFWQEENGPIEDLLRQYNNCVVQSIIEQHPALAVIHSESINSIRIMTMILDGEVIVLSSVLRFGVGNAKVDNVSSGGIACGIDENGCLKEKSFNGKGQSWIGHPNGIDLKGKKVPSFEECRMISKDVAPRFTRFAKLVSWDFAVNKNGCPILIEANLYGGELDFHQMCNGPIFGDEEMTKAMIDRFYRKK